MANVGAKLTPFMSGQNHSVFTSSRDHHLRCRSNLSVTMEEEDLTKLQSDSYSQKFEILDRLFTQALTNGGYLPFRNCSNAAVYACLSSVLSDPQEKVRIKCIELIQQVLGQQENKDDCMSYIMPKLIPNIGDSKIAIRKIVTQTLKMYISLTNDLQMLLSAIIKHGINNHDMHIKREMILALPTILQDDHQLANENFFELVQALCQCLRGCDAAMKRVILTSLSHLRKLLGDSIFSNNISHMPQQQQRYYYEAESGELTFHSDSNYEQLSDENIDDDCKYVDDFDEEEEKEFGVVDKHITDKINNRTNLSARLIGMEQLNYLVEHLDSIGIHCLQPHLLAFISFLHNLIDETHFKLSTLTLDTIVALVEVLGEKAKPYTRPFVTSFSRRMMDGMMRVVIMKGFMTLMHAVKPRNVLPELADNLKHKNHKVRQETLNVIIATVFKFPSNELDFGNICKLIAHTLIDPKRPVRLASFECFSVIAQSMGPGRLQPLVTAVDSVELASNGYGVLKAVQDRLERKLLPKINSDGLIDYSTPLTSKHSVRGSDIDWIEQASLSSARSERSVNDYHSSDKTIEIEPVSSSRSTPALNSGGTRSSIIEPKYSPDLSTPRRIISAKSKSKLPWSAGSSQSYNNNKIDDELISVSSTWSAESSKTPRKVLDPIPKSASDLEREINPVPTKAILARSNSAKNSSRVPPIASNRRPPSGRPSSIIVVDNQNRSDSDTLTPSSIDDDDDDDDDDNNGDIDTDELNMSLKGIRDSASMRKASKGKTTNDDISKPPQVPTPNYSPHGGVTFQSNRILDGGIIGKRLVGDDIQLTLNDPTLVTIEPKKNPIATKRRISIKSHLVSNPQPVVAGIGDSDSGDNMKFDDFQLKGYGVRAKNDTENPISNPMPIANQPKHQSRIRRRTKQENVSDVTKTISVPQLVRRNSLNSNDTNDTDDSNLKDDDDTLTPFSANSQQPFQLITNALAKIAKNNPEDWESKCDGLKDLRRLACFHSDSLSSQVHSIALAVCAEIKNLRSQVSRSALVCLRDLFVFNARTMDSEMDMFVKFSLIKSGESNNFIKKAVDDALDSIVENTLNTNRCLTCLLNNGIQHKNVSIRTATARSIRKLVEKNGATKILEKQDLCERILTTAVKLLQDGSSKCRVEAGRIVNCLANNNNLFEKMLAKYVSSDLVNAVRSKIDKYKISAPKQDEPSSASSTSSRNSRYSTGPTISSQLSVEQIKSLTTQLSASDFRERQKGIERLVNIASTNHKALGTHIIRILDKIIACARDSNSKVTLQTLQALPTLIRQLNGYISAASAGQLSLLIESVTMGMANKNKETKQEAMAALDSLMELDAAQILQPFVNQAQKANILLKPELVRCVAHLVSEVYPIKPNAVSLHALPLLWHAIERIPNGAAPSNSQLGQAATNLALVFHSIMGESLFDKAPSRYTAILRDLLKGENQ